jgi:SAM-dependent methyltransferase
MMCLICHSINVEIFTENPDIFICNNCNNAFRKPSPAKINYTTKIPMPDFFSTSLMNMHHYNFIEKNLGFNNIKSILEIGSGNGALIRYIRKKNKDIAITSIEPGAIFCKKLLRIKNVTVINDYMEKIQINDKFDLVIMSHVLEHLENPLQSIKYVYKECLSDGSALYLDVPNQDYELRNKLSAKMAPMMHLFFFSGLGIKHLLNIVGFNDEDIIGNKYSTLPRSFIQRTERLGIMRDRRNISIIINKILNRFSVYISSFEQVIFRTNIKEIKLENSNSYFNNMAIIAKKFT